MDDLNIMQEFTLKTLPNLDIAVLAALELLNKEELPIVNLQLKKALVIGSGNALVTGKIMFEETDAIFADESTYERKLKGIKHVVLISASGSKHAIKLAEKLKKLKISLKLLTCNEEAPAKEFINSKNIFFFPKNREPYTYNVSTYLSMILSKTKENPKEILEFIQTKIDQNVPKDLSKYNSFFIIIPKKFELLREMFLNKFDELFGAVISARVFTSEQIRHGKTIVPSNKELFISIGEENNIYGSERLNLPLPQNADYAAVMAIGYYLIGKIQEQNKHYFKNNLLTYTKEISKIFNQEIKPIVEG